MRAVPGILPLDVGEISRRGIQPLREHLGHEQCDICLLAEETIAVVDPLDG